MSAIVNELKHTIRLLLRNPGSSLITTIILALGLALTMYMFGAIDAYILEPLPFPDSKTLTHLELANPSHDQSSIAVAPQDFLDWRKQQQSFESLAAFYRGTINVSGGSRPERYDGAFVTSNTLSILKVRPHLGRVFVNGEDQPGAQPVAVLSFNLWKNRYSGDAQIIGKTIRVNARDAEVVGVMPPAFHFPVQEDIWIPLSLDVKNLRRDEGMPLEVFGRLKQGVSLRQGRAEMQTIVARLAKQYPDTNAGYQAVVKPFAEEFVSKAARAQIYTMFAAVVLVLLIACANVANITMVRSIARKREFALRSSLGAARWRLILQVLTESTLISFMAGTAAYFLATSAGKWTIETLRTNPNITPPYWVDFGTDWRTVIFATAIAAVSGILAGIFPALRASRTDLNSALHQGGYSVAQPLGRASKILITSQIALSCILLISAGLMSRSILNIRKVDVGARVDNVLTGRIGLMEAQYPEADSRVQFFENLQERLAHLPGVKTATISTSLPGSFSGGNFYTTDLATTPEKGRPPIANVVDCAPNYFSAFEIPILSGRTFDSRDRKDGAPVVIVNQLLAEKAWPRNSAIGHRVKLGLPDDKKTRWLTVIGVVPNVQQDEVSDELRPTVYLPLAQGDTRFASVALISNTNNAKQLAEPLRKAVAQIDPDQPVYWIRSLQEWIQIGRFGASFIGTLFIIFAGVALVLAAAGQYALLAYSVQQRTREIGVRRALGALDEAVIRLLLGQGLRQFFTALCIGLPFAFGFSFLLSNQLFGVKPFDPLTFLLVPVVLFFVSVLAGLLPAQRALKVDPVVALRTE